MSARESLNHGYFYDALSGRFSPPSDPERQHTLARLLNGTLEKGAISNPNSHQETRIYTPAWAPVESVATVSHWDIKSLAVRGLGKSIQIVHTFIGGEDRHYRGIELFDSTEGDGPVLKAALGHEANYSDIQDQVALLAQRFFDNFPAS